MQYFAHTNNEIICEYIEKCTSYPYQCWNCKKNTAITKKDYFDPINNPLYPKWEPYWTSSITCSHNTESQDTSTSKSNSNDNSEPKYNITGIISIYDKYSDKGYKKDYYLIINNDEEDIDKTSTDNISNEDKNTGENN